jgi:hypothetical protein
MHQTKSSAQLCKQLQWNYDLKRTIFWDIMPYSPLKVNWHSGGSCRLHIQGQISWARYQWECRYQAMPPAFVLASSLAHSTMKMEAIRSSKTSVDFQRTTWSCIPEDRTLLNHLCTNHKSYKLWFVQYPNNYYKLLIFAKDQICKTWKGKNPGKVWW